MRPAACEQFMEEREVICDRATALAILRAAAAMEHAPRPYPGAQQSRAQPIRRKSSVSSVTERRACGCGSCRACIDNARWERIFNEKFVDVEYYGGLRLSRVSPLAGL